MHRLFKDFLSITYDVSIIWENFKKKSLSKQIDPEGKKFKICCKHGALQISREILPFFLLNFHFF